MTTTILPDLLSEVRTFRTQHPQVTHVDLICMDLPGHFYGKRYPIDMLEKVAAGAKLKLPQNCILLGTQGGLYPIGDYCFRDGDPDAARRPIPGSLKRVPWEPQPLAQMLISSENTDRPIEFEPRVVLARVLERLARRGLRPVVAFELEFYLFAPRFRAGLPQYPRAVDGHRRDDQPNMHIERLSHFSSVLAAMVSTANEQGIDANVISAELGPGQFEINFGHSDDALQAADWAALFRRSTQGVARQHGYRASFMSKPYLQAPGSGMHVHVSLYDHDGRNVLAANQQQALRHAVAGCLELLPHCMPIFAANHNAFRRYGSMVNSASQASWGFEDRDASIRIPESDPHNLRIEHRLAGADANPYLVLAAILTGLEHGLDNGREPITPLNQDRSSGIDFPKDMLSAVTAMRDHPQLAGSLGSEFVMVYCENKRQEYLDFMNEISPREYHWYA